MRLAQCHTFRPISLEFWGHVGYSDIKTSVWHCLRYHNKCWTRMRCVDFELRYVFKDVMVII